MTAVEILVGTSIAALILIATTHTVVRFISAAQEISEKTQAVYLAEDGMELVRYIRDTDWATIGALAEDVLYYLAPTESGVVFDASPEVLGEYTRSVVVHDVYRSNTTDDIVASTTAGSSPDADTRYITITVTWGVPTQSVSLVSIFSNHNP